MSKSRLIIAIILSFLMGVVGTMAVTVGMHRFGIGKISVDAKEYERLQYMDEKYGKAEELWTTIQGNFYQDIDDETLETGMYRGLFEATEDEYSAYMTKEEYENWIATLTGEFEGVGVTYRANEEGEGYQILQIFEGSPAEKAGLKAGDIMLTVDGKTYETIEDFGNALRGKAGSEVKVTYKRDGTEAEVTMVRAKIVNKTVKSEVRSDNIGYIQITAFEPTTYEDFRTALTDLESKNVKGLIIDLRDNGGGLVMQAQKVADDLLGAGDLYYTKDGQGREEHYESNGAKTALPYVLLVNENTASASEILSAAVQDNKGGALVGVKTYGKGVIQIDHEMADGSGYKLTVMQYFSPKGNTIHRVGITPDYEIKDPEQQLQKAAELLK